MDGRDPMGEDPDLWGIELDGPDPSETRVPLPQYAVPATSMGILPPMSLVTIGEPGQWWLLDRTVALRGPDLRDGVETYEMAALSDWGACHARRRRYPDTGPVELATWWMPAAEIWVYRPAPVFLTVDLLPPRRPLENLQTDLLTPPSPRRPRPARELPSLSGRTVTVPDRQVTDFWMSVTAVTEPFTLDGDLVVRVAALPHAPYLAYGLVDHVTTWTVPLHRVWTY